MDNTNKIKLAELKEKLNALLGNLSISKANFKEELDVLNSKEIEQGGLSEKETQRKIEIIDKIEKISKEETLTQENIRKIDKAENEINNPISKDNENVEGEEKEKIEVNEDFLKNIEDNLTSVEIFLGKKREEDRGVKDFGVDKNVKNVIVDEKVVLNELGVSEKILQEASDKIKKINSLAKGIEIKEGKISNGNLKQILEQIENEYADILAKDNSGLLRDKILGELKRKQEVDFKDFVKNINTFTDGLIQINKGKKLNTRGEIIEEDKKGSSVKIGSLAFSEAEEELKNIYKDAKSFLEKDIVNDKTQELISNYEAYLEKLKENAKNGGDAILEERTRSVSTILEQDILNIKNQLNQQVEEARRELEEKGIVDNRKLNNIQNTQLKLKGIGSVLENIGKDKYVGQQGIQDIENEIIEISKTIQKEKNEYEKEKQNLEKIEKKYEEVKGKISFFETGDALYGKKIYNEKKKAFNKVEEDYLTAKEILEKERAKLEKEKAKGIKYEKELKFLGTREEQEKLIDELNLEEKETKSELERLRNMSVNLKGKEKEKVIKEIEDLEKKLHILKKDKELAFKKMGLSEEEKENERNKIETKRISFSKIIDNLEENVNVLNEKYKENEKDYEGAKREMEIIDGVIKGEVNVKELQEISKKTYSELKEQENNLSSDLDNKKSSLKEKLKAIENSRLSIEEKSILKEVVKKTGGTPKFKGLVDEKLLEKIEKDKDLAFTLNDEKKEQIQTGMSLYNKESLSTKSTEIEGEVNEKSQYVENLSDIKKGSNRMSHIDNKYGISNGMGSVLGGYFDFFKAEYQHIDSNFERKYQDYNNIDKTNALYLTFYDKVINNIVDKSIYEDKNNTIKGQGDLNAKIYLKGLVGNKENITLLKKLFGDIHIKYFVKVSKYNSSKLTEKLGKGAASRLLVKFQDAIIKADSIILNNEEQGGENYNPYITGYSQDNPGLKYLEGLKDEMKSFSEDNFVKELFAFGIAFKDLEYKTAALLEIIKEGVPIDIKQRNLLTRPNEVFHNLLKEIGKEDLLSPLDNTLISSLVGKGMFSDLGDINDGLRIKAKGIEAFKNYNSISGENKKSFKDLAEHWADASGDEGLRSHFRQKDTIEGLIKEEVNGRLVDKSGAIWYRIKLFMEYSVYPMLSYILYSLNLALRLNVEKIKLIHFNLFLFIAFVFLNVIGYITIPGYAFLIDNIFITKNSITTLLYDFNVYPGSNPLLALLFLVFLIFILFTSGALILVVLFDKVWMLISQALNKDDEAMDRLREIIKMSFLLFVMIVFLNILHIL